MKTLATTMSNVGACLAHRGTRAVHMRGTTSNSVIDRQRSGDHGERPVRRQQGDEQDDPCQEQKDREGVVGDGESRAFVDDTSDTQKAGDDQRRQARRRRAIRAPRRRGSGRRRRSDRRRPPRPR